MSGYEAVIPNVAELFTQTRGATSRPVGRYLAMQLVESDLGVFGHSTIIR